MLFEFRTIRLVMSTLTGGPKCLKFLTIIFNFIVFVSWLNFIYVHSSLTFGFFVVLLSQTLLTFN